MRSQNNQNFDRFHAIACITMGVALIFVLWKHLLIALLAGLLVHEAVVMLEPVFLRYIKVKKEVAKLSLVAFIALIVVTVLILSGIGVVKYFQAGSDNLPALLNKMAEIIDSSRNSLPAAISNFLPSDVIDLQAKLANWLREHAADVTVISKDAGRALVLAIVGMVIGALIALRKTKQHTETFMQLPLALAARVFKLSQSFRRVVFAQFRIAALNTIFTGIYLAIILPLLDVHLPFTKTMIAVTFVVGFLPVIGNLVSNTVIVIVSLSHSVPVALGSLVFLVIVHKLEYFLNARIIGGMIRANTWELLIAMVVLEALYGIAGVVAAPIYYAYLKSELSEANLIPP